MKRLYHLSILSVLFVLIAFPQESSVQKVPVVLKIFRLPQLEMDIVVKDSTSYLPVTGMFEHIGIKADIDTTRMLIRGFFQNTDETYSFDIPGRTAKKKKQTIPMMADDAVIHEQSIYLRTDFLNEFFRLGFKYNPRALVVTVDSFQILPAVKYQRLQQNFLARRQRGGLRLPADELFIERDPWTTGSGRFNYNVLTRYNTSQFYSNYNFSSQAKVVGGDLDLYLRGTINPNRTRTTDPVLRWQYRIPFPDNKAIQQIIFSRRASSDLFPVDVINVEMTNRPLAGRIIHSTETFGATVSPYSNVEYLGGLSGVQFAEADADGRYSIDAPVRYGPNTMQFLSYDRYGRSDILGYYLNIPNSMVRPGEFEYSTSFGQRVNVTDQYVSTNYAKFGVSSNLTVGAIVDYYDISSLSQKWHVGITTTAHILRTLNITGSIVPSASSKMSLQWYPTAISEFVINRFWYAPNNVYNFGNATNRWQVLATVPLHPKNNIRLNLNGEHTQYESDYENFTFSASLNGIFGNIFPSIGTRLLSNNVGGSATTVSHATDFGLGAILPLNLIFNSNISYDHLNHEIQSIRVTFAKTIIDKLNVHFTIQRFPTIPMGILTLNLRYIFPFLDVQTNASRNDARSTTYGLNLAGSMRFDIPSGTINWSSAQMRTPLAGIQLRPFIDENNNSTLDAGEEVVKTGRVYMQDNFVGLPPTTLGKNKFSVDRLNAYKSYSIYLDPTSIEDPRMVPKYTTIRFFSEANYVKNIDLPLVYAGTIRGSVLDTANKPIEGVTVILTPILQGVTNASKFVKKTTTFSTGEFEFALLNPGRYKVEIEQSQLVGSGLTSSPNRREVTVSSKPAGDVSDDQNFQLLKR